MTDEENDKGMLANGAKMTPMMLPTEMQYFAPQVVSWKPGDTIVVTLDKDMVSPDAATVDHIYNRLAESFPGCKYVLLSPGMTLAIHPQDKPGTPPLTHSIATVSGKGRIKLVWPDDVDAPAIVEAKL